MNCLDLAENRNLLQRTRSHLKSELLGFCSRHGMIDGRGKVVIGCNLCTGPKA